jgi:hypothetical protein
MKVSNQEIVILRENIKTLKNYWNKNTPIHKLFLEVEALTDKQLEVQLEAVQRLNVTLPKIAKTLSLRGEVLTENDYMSKLEKALNNSLMKLKENKFSVNPLIEKLEKLTGRKVFFEDLDPERSYGHYSGGKFIDLIKKLNNYLSPEGQQVIQEFSKGIKGSNRLWVLEKLLKLFEGRLPYVTKTSLRSYANTTLWKLLETGDLVENKGKLIPADKRELIDLHSVLVSFEKKQITLSQAEDLIKTRVAMDTNEVLS